MTAHRTAGACAIATILAASAAGSAPTAQPAPLAMDTARVSIAGTSNVHNYSAWTDTVRLTQVKIAPSVAAGTFWEDIVKPGALERLEVAIPVAMLTSRDAGLDRNMHKALGLEAHRDITFRLTTLEGGATGTLMAVGTLRVAGVERQVVLPLQVEPGDGTLIVKGRLPLLMTDFGITPPTAMLGMLKTHPKVTVTFEAVLSVPRT
jgi:polyisoprenoid-binding protein YceI